jgi:hypothetical protein
MKLKIAAVAALGAGSLVAGGLAPAAGNVTHPTFRSAASAGCHTAPSPQPVTEVPGELAAVQFVSATTGWVAGASRVLGTTDGGAKWTLQRSSKGAHYSEVDAIDAHHAWVVGRDQIIATNNGGATWRRLREPCAFVSSVHFVSPTSGFAVAGGKLLKTRNGGRTWHSIHAPARVQSVCFTDNQLGWLGAHGKIYRTVTGGRVWQLAVAGLRTHRVRDEPFASVECAGSDAGWAELIGPGVGMNQQEHIGYHLSDSGSQPIFAEQYFSHPGVHVTANSPGAESAAFSAIDPADAVFIDWCAPCGRGTAPMAVATNDGQTLDRVGRVRNIYQAFGASFASLSDGWAVGALYHYAAHRTTWKIEHTTDGGRHWTTQYVE